MLTLISDFNDTLLNVKLTTKKKMFCSSYVSLKMWFKGSDTTFQ